MHMNINPQSIYTYHKFIHNSVIHEFHLVHPQLMHNLTYNIIIRMADYYMYTCI